MLSNIFSDCHPIKCYLWQAHAEPVIVIRVVHILRNQQRGRGFQMLTVDYGGGGGGGGVGRLLRNQNFNFYPNTNLKFFI